MSRRTRSTRSEASPVLPIARVLVKALEMSAFTAVERDREAECVEDTTPKLGIGCGKRFREVGERVKDPACVVEVDRGVCRHGPLNSSRARWFTGLGRGHAVTRPVSCPAQCARGATEGIARPWRPGS